MSIFHWIRIRADERGLFWENGALVRLLGPGWHYAGNLPWSSSRIDKVSLRQVWFSHPDLDLIARSGRLAGEAEVVDLKDHERALVWVDGRLAAVLGPGVHVLWTAFHQVRVERLDARPVRFEHPELHMALAAMGARDRLDTVPIAAGWAGLVFEDGRYAGSLTPGVHAFWKGEGLVKVLPVDLREQSADISGQEIMTADKVTLRLNTVVTYRVVDPVKAVTEIEGYAQALYRQAQLALRAVVGTRELDVLLSDKDGVAAELHATLKLGVAAFGLEIRALGIRDVILPGEMKEILNRVTEARKAAEATLITRREETAAMRSQANTARIFESNPTLMRLRELEVLEKVAGKANLTVVLGEGGLTERVVKLL